MGKREIHPLFPLAIYKTLEGWRADPRSSELDNVHRPIPAAAVGRAGPAPYLGSTVELGLMEVVLMNLSECV